MPVSFNGQGIISLSSTLWYLCQESGILPEVPYVGTEDRIGQEMYVSIQEICLKRWT
jgi:hypothetical protein